MKRTFKQLACLSLLPLVGAGPLRAGTFVRWSTSEGNIDALFHDNTTPLSVANFLKYVTDDRWDGTFLHRSIPGFIVQGGGFTLDPGIFDTTSVLTYPPVPNEPGLSNVRGTIAYAKLGGDPNSATSQWFFNLADNSANLDSQNGGFTVFGEVIGLGMSVVDGIASLDRIDAGGAFTDVPVTDLDQVIEQQDIFNSEAVVVNDVSVISPIDHLTLFACNSHLRITFEEAVLLGSGEIEVFLADGTPVKTIDVTDGTVTINGAEATIGISDLAVNTAYYVNVDPGAFIGVSTYPHGGIDDPTTWTFTTDSAIRITSFTSVGTGLWELSLEGCATTPHELRSSATLEFAPSTLVENITQANPASDPGTIGGPNNSLITTNANGHATMRVTLTGTPSTFVRAVACP